MVYSINGIGGVWGLSDYSFTLYDIRYVNDEGLMVAYNDEYLRLSCGEIQLDDTSVGRYPTDGTLYYLRIVRQGTSVYCQIWEDALHTIMSDNLSISCSAEPYEYVFGMLSYGASSGFDIDYTVQDLDLNLGLAPPVDNEPSFDGFFYPENETTELCPCCIILGVDVYDKNGDVINITFYSNLTGNWDKVLSFAYVYNGSYYGIVCNFTKFDYTYYWNVSILGSGGLNISGTFNFNTTADIECIDSQKISFDPTLIIFILFCLFFYVANQFNDYLLSIMSGILLLSLAMYYFSSFELVHSLVAVVILLGSLYCFGLGFYFAPNFRKK